MATYSSRLTSRQHASWNEYRPLGNLRLRPLDRPLSTIRRLACRPHADWPTERHSSRGLTPLAGSVWATPESNSGFREPIAAVPPVRHSCRPHRNSARSSASYPSTPAPSVLYLSTHPMPCARTCECSSRTSADLDGPSEFTEWVLRSSRP